MATADSGDVLPHLRTEAIRAVVGPTSADRGFAIASSGAGTALTQVTRSRIARSTASIRPPSAAGSEV